jgi:chitinase
LIGYWHNFDNGSTVIKLRNVSPKFDVINVAFGEPESPGSGKIVFTPFNATVDEFKQDIKYLQSQGKKVLLSIGGANGVVELTDSTKTNDFINSVVELVNTYGFNGIDIDIEGSCVALDPGDTDFKNPKTPKVVNLINALKTICDRMGPNFMLTMAPETAHVYGGYSVYGGPWGAYLPIIYALRDKITFVHVQHYNSGSMVALDGRSYSQGTADFHVAMAEMLIRGFPVAGNPNNVFPGLREDQVAIGIPACPNAASGGYTKPDEMKKALDYLILGKEYGGSYKLINSSGYRNFRGLMTWSINWDTYYNFEFSNTYRAYFDSLK